MEMEKTNATLLDVHHDTLAKDIIQETNEDVPNTSDNEKENSDVPQVNLDALPIDSNQQTAGFQLLAIQFLKNDDVPEVKQGSLPIDSSILTSDGEFNGVDLSLDTSQIVTEIITLQSKISFFFLTGNDNSIGLSSIADGSIQDFSHMLDSDEDILINVKDFDGN